MNNPNQQPPHETATSDIGELLEAADIALQNLQELESCIVAITEKAAKGRLSRVGQSTIQSIYRSKSNVPHDIESFLGVYAKYKEAEADNSEQHV